uniref:Uncharacterized protein n=1 Tax=Cacopsylla melanoneura TaxID=428564 RepID=A0A8D8VDA9_9HEMI
MGWTDGWHDGASSRNGASTSHDDGTEWVWLWRSSWYGRSQWTPTFDVGASQHASTRNDGRSSQHGHASAQHWNASSQHGSSEPTRSEWGGVGRNKEWRGEELLLQCEDKRDYMDQTRGTQCEDYTARTGRNDGLPSDAYGRHASQYGRRYARYWRCCS